jgi:tetratricopeptide (TPR) repeat protein
VAGAPTITCGGSRSEATFSGVMPAVRSRSPFRLLLVLSALSACAEEKHSFKEVMPQELLLEVLPASALVELDGTTVGTGSRAIPVPDPGEHTLVVSAAGFEPLERPLPKGPLANQRVSLVLRPEGFGQSQRLEYDEPTGLAAAAAALNRAGRHADAVDYATRAVALNGKLPPALRALGDALAKVGRRNEARAAWGRYLSLVPDAPDADAVARRMSEGRATFDMKTGE